MALSVRESIAELSDVGLTDDLALLLADPEPHSPSVGSLSSSKKPGKSASPEKKQTVSTILNKFDKKWKKSTHSVLSSRYDAAPHKPPILLKRELSRLSDPIAGKFKNWKEYDDKINGKGRDEEYGDSMGGAFLTGLIEDERSVGSVGSKKGAKNQPTTFLTSDEARDEEEGSLSGFEPHIKYGKFDKPGERAALGGRGVRGGTVSKLRGKLEEAARMNYKRSRGLQSSVLDQSYDGSVQPGPKGRFGRRGGPPHTNGRPPVRGRQTNGRGSNAMNTSRDYGRSSGYGVSGNGTGQGSRSVSRTRKNAASKPAATFDMNGRRIKNPAKDGANASGTMGSRSMRSRANTLNNATGNKNTPSTSTRGSSVRNSSRDPLKNISGNGSRGTARNNTNNASSNNSRSRYGMRKSKSDALNTSTSSNASTGSTGNKENSRNMLRSKSATMRSSAHNGAGGALSAIRERKAIRKNSRTGIPANNNNNNNNNNASALGSRNRATGSAPSHLSSSRNRGKASTTTNATASNSEPRPSAPEKRSVTTKGKVIASTGAGSSRPSSRITREFAGKDKENVRYQNTTGATAGEEGGETLETSTTTSTTTTATSMRGSLSSTKKKASGTSGANNSYRPTVDVLKALASVQQSENERIMRKNGIPVHSESNVGSDATSTSTSSSVVPTKMVSKALSKGPGGKVGSNKGKGGEDKSYAAILAAKANKLQSHINQAESLTKKIVAVDEAEAMAMNLETSTGGIPPLDLKMQSDVKEGSSSADTDSPVGIEDISAGGAPKKVLDTSVRLKAPTVMPSESKLDELQQSMDEQRLKQLLEADKNIDDLE